MIDDLGGLLQRGLFACATALSQRRRGGGKQPHLAVPCLSSPRCAVTRSFDAPPKRPSKRANMVGQRSSGGWVEACASRAGCGRSSEAGRRDHKRGGNAGLPLAHERRHGRPSPPRSLRAPHLHFTHPPPPPPPAGRPPRLGCGFCGYSLDARAFEYEFFLGAHNKISAKKK